MTESYQLDTPEAVSLSYQIAGIGSRFLAQLIDSLLWLAGVVITLVMAVVFTSYGGSSTIAEIFAGTVVFLLTWGYYIVFETLWEGQTPGKRSMHIRVLKVNGYPITVVDAVVRNLVRIADFLPSFYGLGVIVMFISPESRRLGDYAAGTVVVKERDALMLAPAGSERVTGTASPTPARGSTDPEELAWDLTTLDAEDTRIIREFLQRAPHLQPQPRQSLGNEIAHRVAGMIRARDPLDPERFLRRVLELDTAERNP